MAGTVIWITGLSGSGKTTVATYLHTLLKQQDKHFIILDGDKLREIFGTTGYSTKDRYNQAFRYSKLCQALSSQGTNIICSTIALFHDVHLWNRQNIPNYLEVFLDVPMKTLMQRDQKSLYSKSQTGEASNVVGIDIKAEIPKYPNLVINNYESITAKIAATTILCKFNNNLKHQPLLKKNDQYKN